MRVADLGRGPRGQGQETAVGSNEWRETQSRELMAFPPSRAVGPTPCRPSGLHSEHPRSVHPGTDGSICPLARLPQVKGSPRNVSLRLLGGPAHTSGGSFPKGRQKLRKVLSGTRICAELLAAAASEKWAERREEGAENGCREDGTARDFRGSSPPPWMWGLSAFPAPQAAPRTPPCVGDGARVCRRGSPQEDLRCRWVGAGIPSAGHAQKNLTGKFPSFF